MTRRIPVSVACAALLLGMAAPSSARAQQTRGVAPPPTVLPDEAPARGSTGWLGISVLATADSRNPTGVVTVTDVWAGGPAARGGLQVDDRIIRVNDTAVSVERFRSLVSRMHPGDPIALTVLREGREVELALVAEDRPPPGTLVPARLQRELDSVRSRLVTIMGRSGMAPFDQDSSVEGVRFQARVRFEAPHIQVERVGEDSIVTRVILQGPEDARGATFLVDGLAPTQSRTAPGAEGGRPAGLVVRLRQEERRREEDARPLAPFLAGMNRVAGAELRPLNPALGRYFQVEDGLLVTEVAEGTPAAGAGLRPGDVVVAANGFPVRTLDQLRARLSTHRGGSTLTVVRQGAEREIPLR